MRVPPHLPFLAGPPDFVVGLKPIALEAWLTPDWEAQTLPDKRALLAARAAEVVRQTADGEAFGAEAARLVREAVSPQAPAPRTLAQAAGLISDDLVALAPEGGRWRVVSAVLCSPTYFSAANAIGATLAELHGPVPDRLGPEGGQALALRAGRVFSNLAPDQVLERFNWTVQAGPERFTPSGVGVRARAVAATPADAAGLVHLRVERQTIRRLPETGGLLFTIRVSLDPLTPILANGPTRAAFARAWRGAPAHVAAYKRWETIAHLVEALL